MLQAIDTANVEFPATIEAGPLSPPFEEEVVILSDVGSLSSCDVWFTVPSAWLAATVVRVHARVGKARVLVREARLGSVATTSAGDLRSGIAISLRGRPCRCFEVSLYAGDEDLVGGYFYLQSWHGGAEIAMTPGDDPAPGVSVTARLQGRDAVSGAFVDVVTDDQGRLLVDNPVLGDDFLRLPDVTTVPAPTTNEVRVYNDGGVLYAAPPDAASLLTIKVPKRTGTGSNAGIPLAVEAQDGRNVASGSNSDGGVLTLSAGDVGTGGTGSTGRGGRLILQVGAGGGSHGTLDFDMATAISNASPKTRWLLDGSEFASLQRERVSGFVYTYNRSASGLFCEATAAAIVKASSVTFDIGAGNTIVAMDASAKPRLTQSLGNTTAITAGETVTSFQVNHTKLSGTGAVVGATLQVKAQDGQNGTGTQPNSGGILSLESGAKGASTENAFDGNVVIKTGSTTRVTVSGNGLDATNTSKVHSFRDLSALEHLQLVTDSTESNVPATPTRLAIWQNTGRLLARTHRNVLQDLNCQDSGYSPAPTAMRHYDRLVRFNTTTASTTQDFDIIPAADLPPSSPTWVARFNINWGGFDDQNNTAAGGTRQVVFKCIGGTITVVGTASNQLVGTDHDESTVISSGAASFAHVVSGAIRFRVATLSGVGAVDVKYWVRIQGTLVQY